MISNNLFDSRLEGALCGRPARRIPSDGRLTPCRRRGIRRAWMRVGVALLITLASLAASFASPREEFTKSFQKSLSMQTGQSLTVDHKYGSVALRTHPSSQVNVNASIRVAASSQSEAAEFANRISIDVRQTSAGVAVQTVYPEHRGGIFSGRSAISYSVDYSIELPENVPVQVRNSFGDVTLSGLKAAADLSNSHGKVELTGAAGPSSVTGAFGAVKVLDIAGDLTVKNQNGSIDAKNISGNAQLDTSFASVDFYNIGARLSVTSTNSSINGGKVGGSVTMRNTFGSVTVSDVIGNADIQNSNGKITVKEIRGNALLRTTFGPVEATGITGSATVNDSNSSIKLTDVDGLAEVHTTFGRVDLSGLRQGAKVYTGNASVSLAGVNGDAYVKTSFGSVQAEHIAGSLTVENTNGAVHGTGIKGGAEINTSFGPTILEGVGGGVRVESRNGSIEVSGVAARQPGGGCNAISLKTSFAPIKLALNPEASYNATVRTTFGRISSELPLTVSGGINSQSLSGKIGKGECELVLTNTNGNIDILKAGAKN